MKKKVIVITVSLMLMVSGIAHAAAVWGKFEGNNIVRVQHNGKTIQAQDVPAINYNGRTMVPIYMLRNLGLGVTWDQKNYTVDVSNINSTSQKVDALKKYSVTANMYNDLHEFYYRISILEVALSTTVVTKNLQGLAGNTSDYIELLSELELLESTAEETLQYTGGYAFKVSSFTDILSDYKNSLTYISDAIDYAAEIFKSDNQISRNKFVNSINSSHNYVSNGEMKSREGYLTFQKLIFDYE